MIIIHCTLSIAAQCIVIGPVCGGRCLLPRELENMRASILTKRGLLVKVVTISSWLNFGRPAPPGRGLLRGNFFWLRLTTASVQCLRLSQRFFITLRAKHSGAVYCNRSCLWRKDGRTSGGTCLWRAGGDCYHDNSKLRASIFTELGL